MGAPGDRELLEELRALQAQLARLRSRVAGGVDREAVPRGPCSLLVCRVGRERVALLQSLVAEVVMMARLTPLPESPCWVAGLLNLRGQSVAVVDALARISQRPRQPQLSDRIVICEVRGRRVGFVVQEILSVETVDGSAVQPAPPDAEPASYLLGAFQREDATTLLLSAVALLETSSVPTESA